MSDITITAFSSAKEVSANGRLVDLVIVTEEHGTIPITVDLDDVSPLPHVQECIDWVEANQGVVVDYPTDGSATSDEHKRQVIEDAIQALHDSTAQANGYDDINSVGKYSGYVNPFQVECEALGLWVANCWQTAYALLAQWEAGHIAEPSVQGVLDLMPVYVPPT